MSKQRLKNPAQKAADKVDGLGAHVRNWKALIEYVKTATENELWDLLKYELKNRKRRSTVFRIYSRVRTMRDLRENKELHLALSK